MDIISNLCQHIQFFFKLHKRIIVHFHQTLNKINHIKPLLTHLPLCRSQCSPGSVHLKSMQPRHLEVIGSQVGWGALHSWLLEQPRNMYLYFQSNEQEKIALLSSQEQYLAKHQTANNQISFTIVPRLTTIFGYYALNKNKPGTHCPFLQTGVSPEHSLLLLQPE